jgi:hypothetical protein
MVTYGYMNMAMKGSMMGTKKIEASEVYKDYMMDPDKMTMQMHMFMAMYGVSDKFTLMAMGSYVATDMHMNMQPMIMPGGTTMTSSGMSNSSMGLSDTRIYGLYNLSHRSEAKLVASVGVSLPTGSIDKKGTTTMGDNQQLSYCMQTGTGSVAVLPGVAYVFNKGKWAKGFEWTGDIKLNDNSRHYRFGNSMKFSPWVAYSVVPFLSVSVRGEYVKTGVVKGRDAALNETTYQDAVDPTTVSGNYGGKVLSLYGGANLHLINGCLKNLSLNLEYGIPAYQNVNGMQSALKSTFISGVNYKF